MTTEAHAPPTEADRERRDMEFLRKAQLRYAQGYAARLSEPHPAIRDKDGNATQNKEPRWLFPEETAEERCPRVIAPQMSSNGGTIRPGETWPEHERQRWRAGWLHCNTLCAEHGLSHAKRVDPTKPHRKKPVALAEPLDAFPDTVVALKEAKAFWQRYRGVAVAAPTLPDAENA